MNTDLKLDHKDTQMRIAEAHRLCAAVTATNKSLIVDPSSKNASLLTKAGYITQIGAGLYTLMPLGLRVLNRIENIVRSEMNSSGASEFLSPVIHPKEVWSTTGRWETVDVLFKLNSHSGAELCLAATAEEVITNIAKGLIRSYRDLPLATYQIQSKCRDELRPRAGLLRGREFRMKDLYSFHLDSTELERYYEQVCTAYQRIFARCGIGHRTVRTFASGGVFSQFSDEFQLLSDSGEDTIFLSDDGKVAINAEVAKDAVALEAAFGGAKMKLTECRAIEVGNTFKLGTRFTDAFDLKVINPQGQLQSVLMCCYGIGTTRLVGAIAEVCSDELGLVWPEQVAPYDAHLITLGVNDSAVDELKYKTIKALTGSGVSVLIDDRSDVRAGEKFHDADLIGIPKQVIIGKHASESRVEFKKRGVKQADIVDLERLQGIFRP